MAVTITQAEHDRLATQASAYRSQRDQYLTAIDNTAAQAQEMQMLADRFDADAAALDAMLADATVSDPDPDE